MFEFYKEFLLEITLLINKPTRYHNRSIIANPGVTFLRIKFSQHINILNNLQSYNFYQSMFEF